MTATTKRPLTIRKEAHRAVIYVERYRIVGVVHLPPNGRVSDFINWNLKEGPFIPLTDVSVYDAERGERLFQADFLAVHRNHIRFLTLDRSLGSP